MKSIVIAKNKENKDWVAQIPNGWNIHLYDKDNNLVNAPGREAHTYFKFIVDNYDTLEGDYIFCQCNPFDHCPTFLDELYNGYISGRAYPCTRIDRTMPSDGNAIQSDNYIEILGLDVPSEWTFLAGAQFKVPSDKIKSRSKQFYKTCLELSETDPQSGYIFEGLWRFIFNLNQ